MICGCVSENGVYSTPPRLPFDKQKVQCDKPVDLGYNPVSGPPIKLFQIWNNHKQDWSNPAMELVNKMQQTWQTHTQINTYIIQYSNLILKNKHYKIEYSVMTYDKIKWNII